MSIEISYGDLSPPAVLIRPGLAGESVHTELPASLNYPVVSVYVENAEQTRISALDGREVLEFLLQRRSLQFQEQAHPNSGDRSNRSMSVAL